MENQQVIQHNNLKTDRTLLKTILLSIVTLGIYLIVIQCEMANSINKIATKYDDKKTMHFIPAVLLGYITFGIYPLIWINNYTNRIGNELKRRDIDYKFDASTFWLWGVLGSLIAVGPYVFLHKQMNALNMLSVDFNQKG